MSGSSTARPEAFRSGGGTGADPLAGLDRLTVRGIRAHAHHGVLPAEREFGQRFSLDLTLHLSTAAAGRRDRLGATVNYAEVAAVAHEELRAGPYDLVETVAERVAARVLAGPGAPLVRRVEVTLHKPAAPVGLPVDDVHLHIVRDAAPVEAVLALGSNLGDREQHLRSALHGLAATPGVEVGWTSPVVATAPVGGPGGQGAFLNAVIGARTVLDPAGLLSVCRRLEHEAQRVRDVRWGPRTLDVDVITYGELRSDDPELVLPHPRAHERAFVLDPWQRARPEAELPGHGPIRGLLAGAADRSGVVPGPELEGFGLG